MFVLIKYSLLKTSLTFRQLRITTNFKTHYAAKLFTAEICFFLIHGHHFEMKSPHSSIDSVVLKSYAGHQDKRNLSLTDAGAGTSGDIPHGTKKFELPPCSSLIPKQDTIEPLASIRIQIETANNELNVDQNSEKDVRIVKTPPTAFIMYRAALAKVNQHIENHFLSKHAGEKWINESPEVREHFLKMAEKGRLKHFEMFPDSKYRWDTERKSSITSEHELNNNVEIPQSPRRTELPIMTDSLPKEIENTGQSLASSANYQPMKRGSDSPLVDHLSFLANVAVLQDRSIPTPQLKRIRKDDPLQSEPKSPKPPVNYSHLKSQLDNEESHIVTQVFHSTCTDPDSSYRKKQLDFCNTVNAITNIMRAKLHVVAGDRESQSVDHYLQIRWRISRAKAEELMYCNSIIRVFLHSNWVAAFRLRRFATFGTHL